MIALHPFSETSLIFFYFYGNQIKYCTKHPPLHSVIFDPPFLWLLTQHMYTFIRRIIQFYYINHFLLPVPNDNKDAHKEWKTYIHSIHKPQQLPDCRTISWKLWTHKRRAKSALIYGGRGKTSFKIRG